MISIIGLSMSTLFDSFMEIIDLFGSIKSSIPKSSSGLSSAYELLSSLEKISPCGISSSSYYL